MIAEQIIKLIDMHLEQRAQQDQLLIKQLRELLKHAIERGQIH